MKEYQSPIEKLTSWLSPFSTILANAATSTARVLDRAERKVENMNS